MMQERELRLRDQDRRSNLESCGSTSTNLAVRPSRDSSARSSTVRLLGPAILTMSTTSRFLDPGALVPLGVRSRRAKASSVANTSRGLAQIGAGYGRIVA
jgi:hypothetical protein